MTPTEINRRLALAIGYEPADVRKTKPGRFSALGTIQVCRQGRWYVFNFQHAGTIYPIAEKYKMFPTWIYRDETWLLNRYSVTEHTCPRACIALAVIEAKERGLL